MLKPFMLDSMGFSIQCSIGIALLPAGWRRLDDLIKRSGHRDVPGQRRGRGSYGCRADERQPARARRWSTPYARRWVYAHGRAARCNIATGRITRRALLRGRTASLARCISWVFIPLAEESGYIVTLGAYR